MSRDVPPASGRVSKQIMRTSVFIASAVIISACGVQGGVSGEDAGSAGNVDEEIADAGVLPPLWPVDASRVEATRRGGYPTPYCDTDAGVVEGATYVVTLPEGRLQYSVCTGYLPPRKYWNGELVLDPAQLGRFDDAMRELSRSDVKALWADAPELVLLLTTPGGMLRYQDDFDAVQARPDTVYVIDAEPVFSLLQELAGVTW